MFQQKQDQQRVCLKNFIDKKIIFRNARMLPLTTGIIGFGIQFMAILSLLVPKIFLASISLMLKPHLFPICYFLEYFLIVCYNKLIAGSFRCKQFLSNFQYKFKYVYKVSTKKLFNFTVFHEETLVSLCVPAFYHQKPRKQTSGENGKFLKAINWLNKYGFASHEKLKS